MTQKFGVVAIGNAIVDVLAHTTDEFIDSQSAAGMCRGAMALIDQERAHNLYPLMTSPLEMAGGSAGNTMAAYASFGGTGAFIGKVADDRAGRVFAETTRSIGVHYDTAPLTDGPSTAQCLIFVTPDAQRTMNTFLGASTRLTRADIDEQVIARSDILYLEGYLFDEDHAKEAFFIASSLARKHGKRIALSLSDPFCVVRHRDDFRKLIADHVDILFANEEEIRELAMSPDTDAAHQTIAGQCTISVVTKGKRGSTVMSGDQTWQIDPIAPTELVDTTGAGDSYAAGFLFGLTQGYDLGLCGKLGSLAASEVISHMGPRPLSPLKDRLHLIGL